MSILSEIPYDPCLNFSICPGVYLDHVSVYKTSIPLLLTSFVQDEFHGRARLGGVFGDFDAHDNDGHGTHCA